MATYGVGPSASRTNMGPNVNMKSVMGPAGKVYNDGILVFDPAVDLIDQIQPDTFTPAHGTFAASGVVVTLPSSKTRAVYTVPKATLTPYAQNWLDDIISSSKAVSGTVRVAAGSDVAAQTVTVTAPSTDYVIQYDFATDISQDQAAFDAGGSTAVLTETADNESITITKSAS